MEPQLVFLISVLLGLVVWGIMAWDIWLAVRRRPRAEALRPLLLLHAFRFVGLAFLVPGVVSPDLPDGFARPAAYGDLTTSILALLAIATLRRLSRLVSIQMVAGVACKRRQKKYERIQSTTVTAAQPHASGPSPTER
jgi:hypothetical protein